MLGSSFRQKINLTENENEMKLKERDPATCNGYDRALCYNC